MKRLATAVILLIVVLALCVGSQWKLRRMTDGWIAEVEHSAALAGQNETDSAHAALAKVRDEWKASLPLLGSMLPHDELDQIERLFETALQAAENGDEREYLLQAAELRALLAHLPERDAPKIQNIF